MTTVMAEETPDTKLVCRARSGDRAAFERLVTKLEGRLRAVISSKIPSSFRKRLDVDGVLQDTFVRAYQSIGSFEGSSEDDFRRWLSGVASKAVLRAQDDARRHESLELSGSSAGESEGTSPSQALRREERLEELQAAIQTLKEDRKTVLRLTRIEGFSLRETAEKMGRTYEATKKLFWRALKDLRASMSKPHSLRLPPKKLDWEERHADE